MSHVVTVTTQQVWTATLDVALVVALLVLSSGRWGGTRRSGA